MHWVAQRPLFWVEAAGQPSHLSCQNLKESIGNFNGTKTEDFFPITRFHGGKEKGNKHLFVKVETDTRMICQIKKH